MDSESSEHAGPGCRFPPRQDLITAVTDLAHPLAQRMRAVFYLRTLGGADAGAALTEALVNKAGTTLFRHEIAYVLGQMEARAAIPTLLAVLRDASDDAIVRHECGEALGAIADPDTLSALEALCDDAAPEVGRRGRSAAGERRAARASMWGHPWSLLDWYARAGRTDCHSQRPAVRVAACTQLGATSAVEGWVAAVSLADTSPPRRSQRRARLQRSACAGLSSTATTRVRGT